MITKEFWKFFQKLDPFLGDCLKNSMRGLCGKNWLYFHFKVVSRHSSKQSLKPQLVCRLTCNPLQPKLSEMPSTPTKENSGRLRSFKNRGKDQDVSRAPHPFLFFSRSLLFQLAWCAAVELFALFFFFLMQEMRRRRNDVTVELRRVSSWQL